MAIDLNTSTTLNVKMHSQQKNARFRRIISVRPFKTEYLNQVSDNDKKNKSANHQLREAI
jgi:hypothetical protein